MHRSCIYDQTAVPRCQEQNANLCDNKHYRFNFHRMAGRQIWKGVMAALLHIVSYSPLLDFSSAISRLRVYRAEQKRHLKRGPFLDLEAPLLNDNLFHLCFIICSFRKRGCAKFSKEVTPWFQWVVCPDGQDILPELRSIFALSEDVRALLCTDFKIESTVTVHL